MSHGQLVASQTRMGMTEMLSKKEREPGAFETFCLFPQLATQPVGALLLISGPS